MVIGKGGARIKEIGKNARLKIEELVGGKVYLELFVKVEENWTKDSNKIREIMGVG
jgi:GTP-binding protein Era